MNIQCPTCSTDNKIEFGENIVCHNCKNSFAGHSFRKFKKGAMSATSALLLGALATHGTYKYVLDYERPSLRTEYEIIDTCVNGSSYALSQQSRRVKAEICLCALERTGREMTYSEEKKSESEFLTRFQRNAAICSR